MPPEFRTRFSGAEPAFWTVFAGSSSRARERELGYEIVARLSGDTTIERSRRQVETIASSVHVPGWREAGRRIGLVPLKQDVVGGRAHALSLLLTGVVIVLAIACANLAQLFLARSDHRIAEFATRKAIGASTLQLFRLALVESVLLSTIGGVVGVGLAYWLVPVLRALAPSEIPRLAEASVDVRVIATAFIVSALTGCTFGVVPAARLSRLSMLQAMKPPIGSPSKHGSRFRSALVVTQVAAAVTLAALAGLVVRTFLTLLLSSPGFATASRAAFVWSVRESQFPDVSDRRRRLDELIQRLETVPGIVSVAVASGMPFGDDQPLTMAVRPPEDRPADDATPRADLRGVSLNFFKVFEIPLLEGRAFAAADHADGTRVAIVNRTLAGRLASSGQVIGRSLRIGNTTSAPLHRVVGIVADTRWWGTTLAPLNEVYIPLAQDRASVGFVIVHSELDPALLTRAIRTAFQVALPGAPLPAATRAVTLDEMIGRSVASPRLNAILVGSFSAMAWTLAIVGLFGLVAYSVSQRRRELGIRMALGAQPGHVIVATMRSAVVLTAIGIALGLSIGAYVTRLVEDQLYAVNRFDAITFGGAAIAMIVSAGAAAYWPARRAALNDPMAALRCH